MLKDRLPRTEAVNEYHRALDTAKAQIDLIIRSHNMPFAWLDELQRYLNQARDVIANTPNNQDRPHYGSD
jgi:hypothetical protein